MLPGVSLPCFLGMYGHDLAPNPLSGAGPRHLDPVEIYAPMLRARELGYRAMRIWLCEGAEGILINRDVISGVHPVLIESLAVIQESAALSGLRIYWTLLDGHSVRRTNDVVTRAILIEPEHTARFAEMVAAPIASRLDPRVMVAIEAANEPEALMENDDGWPGCANAIRTIAGAIRSVSAGALVTSGMDRAMAPALWKNAPGLDAIDIHAKGEHPLPSRAEIMRELALEQAKSLPLIGGCHGDFVSQPHREDYDAIFRWRLETEA